MFCGTGISAAYFLTVHGFHVIIISLICRRRLEKGRVTEPADEINVKSIPTTTYKEVRYNIITRCKLLPKQLRLDSPPICRFEITVQMIDDKARRNY